MPGTSGINDKEHGLRQELEIVQHGVCYLLRRSKGHHHSGLVDIFGFSSPWIMSSFFWLGCLYRRLTTVWILFSSLPFHKLGEHHEPVI